MYDKYYVKYIIKYYIRNIYIICYIYIIYVHKADKCLMSLEGKKAKLKAQARNKELTETEELNSLEVTCHQEAT